MALAVTTRGWDATQTTDVGTTETWEGYWKPLTREEDSDEATTETLGPKKNGRRKKKDGTGETE